MAIPKFKFRLGSQQHLTLSGKRYVGDYRPDTYNCRLSLRCGPLQASGTGDFTTSDLQSFVDSVIDVVRSLQGGCALTPTKGGTFSLHVSVGNTGMIVTDVAITTLTTDAFDAVGWNTHARFQTPWNEYYNPVDVEGLDVAQLKGLAGHTPSIEGRTKRSTGAADYADL